VRSVAAAPDEIGTPQIGMDHVGLIVISISLRKVVIDRPTR
jgi:hypothetical protein